MVGRMVPAGERGTSLMLICLEEVQEGSYPGKAMPGELFTG